MNINANMLWKSAWVSISMVESAKLFFEVKLLPVVSQFLSAIYFLTTAIALNSSCIDMYSVLLGLLLGIAAYKLMVINHMLYQFVSVLAFEITCLALYYQLMQLHMLLHFGNIC